MSTVRLPNTYSPEEKPPFAFCEPWHASARRPWCIRKVGPEGLKLGGGIQSEPLCRRWHCNGWDLRVRITEAHLEHACKDCVEEYRTLMSRSDGTT